MKIRFFAIFICVASFLPVIIEGASRMVALSARRGLSPISLSSSVRSASPVQFGLDISTVGPLTPRRTPSPQASSTPPISPLIKQSLLGRPGTFPEVWQRGISASELSQIRNLIRAQKLLPQRAAGPKLGVALPYALQQVKRGAIPFREIGPRAGAVLPVGARLPSLDVATEAAPWQRPLPLDLTRARQQQIMRDVRERIIPEPALGVEPPTRRQIERTMRRFGALPYSRQQQIIRDIEARIIPEPAPAVGPPTRRQIEGTMRRFGAVPYPAGFTGEPGQPQYIVPPTIPARQLPDRGPIIVEDF